MNDIKNINLIKLAGLILIIISAISCKRDNNYTGHGYFMDMANSQAFETYGSSPNFSDSITMLTPVEGTVPREMIPYQYGKTFDEQLRAGRELINPLEANEENIARGEAQYKIYCAMCHGETGKGDGHLFTNGLFTAKPTSLVESYVQDKPDGELFHIITLGSISTLMGAHGSQISQDDRWKIVLYLRNGI